MGLGKAHGHLGQTEDQNVAQHHSLILSRIRVAMVRANEESVAGVMELSGMSHDIGMTEAAEVFQWHGQRIRERRDGADSGNR